ncbi:very short patch repair endonuclease [Burkholderia orbicola]|uniref:very short patch repair endonuclease n=1 Tax=Burkholderia orbicola TaxID=2978683 RepID=UPI002A36B734|nr:very short patch repair endonuclease [Burkholderia orbicola]
MCLFSILASQMQVPSLDLRLASPLSTSTLFSFSKRYNRPGSLARRVTLDSLTPAERSERMSRIKGKDTKPELVVRSLVHRAGYRYRLHGKSLPGCPDMVFARRRKVIFVHGCFWHRHEGCRLARMPKTRLGFWRPKLEANAARDREAERRLAELGWKVMIVWECEVKDEAALMPRIEAFLDDTESN